MAITVRHAPVSGRKIGASDYAADHIITGTLSGGYVKVEDFGAVADDTGYLGNPDATDNADAFDAALAYLEELSVQTLDYERLCPPLLFDGHYYTSRPINLKQSLRLIGTGTKNAMATRIRFPADSDGIIVNVQGSTGGGLDDPATTTASGALVDGIHLLGGGGSSGHGFRLRARASIRNGGARNFGQDGVHIFTWSGGGATDANFGNANCFDLNELLLFANGRHGVFVAGSEGNAGYGNGLDCSYNGCWGILDASFLGSFWTHCHTDQNGNRNWVTNAGVTAGTEVFNATDFGEARCEHNGHVWACILGSETAASTTEPGTDAAVWFDQGAGTVGAPAWVSGMQVRSGGPYAAGGCDTNGVLEGANANSRAQFWGVYAEGGQAPCQVRNAGSIEGFIDECQNVGEGQWIRRGQAARQVFSHGIETDEGGAVFNDGAVRLVGNAGFAAGSFYPSTVDGVAIAAKAGSSNDFSIFTPSGAAIATVPTGTNNIELAGNLNVASGKTLKVNGTQVVGAQGAAVADATDAASAITQLNALLARMRAHGLIAS